MWPLQFKINWSEESRLEILIWIISILLRWAKDGMIWVIVLLKLLLVKVVVSQTRNLGKILQAPPIMIKTICWNVQGLGSPRAFRDVKDFLLRTKAQLIFFYQKLVAIQKE